jgi:hypothetical protein
VKTLRSQKLRMPEIIAKPELCCLLRCVDRYWHKADKPTASEFVRSWGIADMARRTGSPLMTRMYGPAVRSKKISTSWR